MMLEKPVNLKEAMKDYRSDSKPASCLFPALDALIRAVEGKSRVRCIVAWNVLYHLDYIEQWLNISKAALEGVEVLVDPNAQKFPRAYKFIPQSTQFRAVYKNGSWRVIDIFRGLCTEKTAIIIHTDKSREAILSNYNSF